MPRRHGHGEHESPGHATLAEAQPSGDVLRRDVGGVAVPEQVQAPGRHVDVPVPGGAVDEVDLELLQVAAAAVGGTPREGGADGRDEPAAVLRVLLAGAGAERVRRDREPEGPGVEYMVVVVVESDDLARSVEVERHGRRCQCRRRRRRPVVGVNGGMHTNERT